MYIATNKCSKLLTNNVITPSQKAVIIAGFLNNQAGELNHNE